MKILLKYIAFICWIHSINAQNINTPINAQEINQALASVMIILNQQYQEAYFDILEIYQNYKKRYEDLINLASLLNEQQKIIAQEQVSSSSDNKEMALCKSDIENTKKQISSCNKRLIKLEEELTTAQENISYNMQQLIELLYKKLCDR